MRVGKAVDRIDILLENKGNLADARLDTKIRGVTESVADDFRQVLSQEAFDDLGDVVDELVAGAFEIYTYMYEELKRSVGLGFDW